MIDFFKMVLNLVTRSNSMRRNDAKLLNIVCNNLFCPSLVTFRFSHFLEVWSLFLDAHVFSGSRHLSMWIQLNVFISVISQKCHLFEFVRDLFVLSNWAVST